MPTLIEDEPDKDKPLALKLDLKELEVYEDGHTEGWVIYTVRLLAGKQEIASSSGGIHYSDLERLVDMLNNLPHDQQVYEPMEPRFEVILEQNDDKTYTVTCFVDDQASVNGIFLGTDIGIRFNASKGELKHFAAELDIERKKITAGKAFRLWLKEQFSK